MKSQKARQLLRVLKRTPLNYKETRRKGSHRRLEAEGRKPIVFSFHDGKTLSPGLVRKILCDDAGLSEEEAEQLL